MKNLHSSKVFPVPLMRKNSQAGFTLPFARCAMAAVVALIAVAPVRAASLSWGTNGAGGAGTWNTTATNWWNGVSNVAWTDTTGTADSAVFGGTAGTVILGSNVGALGLNFGTPGYVLALGSNTLTLGTGGIDASALSSGTTTIGGGGSMALGGNQTWNVGSGATLNAASVISGPTFGITKTGGGLLNLLGVNTFTGAVTISGGTVGIVQDTSLGQASTSTLTLDGGTLKIAGTNLTNTHAITVTANGGTIDEVGFLTVLGATLGNGGSGTLNLTDSAAGTTPGVFVNGLGNYGNFTVNGTNTFAGTININSGANLEYGSTTALSSATINVNSGGRISASGLNVGNNLTVANGGNLAFQNNNAGVFSGTITLSGGTANVHMFDWYNYSTARNGSITGKITGSGGLNVFGPGNPTLTLQGANDYTGATVLSNAGLTVSGASGTIAGSSSLTARNSAVTLDYSTANVDKIKDTASATFSHFGSLTITANTSADTTETLGTLGFSGGNSTITIGSATNRVTTLAPSDVSRTNNSTALIRGTNLNQSVATNVARLILADGGASLVQVGTNTLNNGGAADSTQALKIVPYLFGDITTGGTGSNFVTYDSTLGLRVLTTAEQTTLSAGYITPTDHDNAIAFNGTITASDPTLNSLLFNTTGQTLSGSGTLTIDSGAVASTVAAATIGNGFSSLALGNGEGVFYITTGTTTINTPISVTSGGGITKSGGGTLTLTGANTFTGQVSVNLGTLSLTTTSNALNGTTGTALTLGNNAAFNINNTTQTVTSITFYGSGETVSGVSGTLNLGGGVTMDTTANPNSANTISVSTLNLNGTRTFNVGSSNAIFTTSGTVLATPNLVVSSVIADGTGTNGLTKTGAGTLALTGANTYTGTTTINGGTLILGNNGTTGALSASGTIVNNGTLGFSRTNTVTQGTDFSGSAISGAGGITNFSTGTVVLNQANSFSGPVNIYNGTVSVANIGNSGSNSNLGTNGTINLGSVGTNNAAVTATLLYTGAGETTDKVVKLNGLTSNSTSIIDASGSGLLKFTSAVTGVDGSKTLTLQGTGTGELAGALNNFGTGVLSLTKSGTGTWTLSGNNTFTGATTVNTGGTLVLSGSNAPSATTVSGTLQLRNANALTGTLSLNSGSTVQLRADSDTTFNSSTITLNSDPTTGGDTTSFNFDVNAATAAGRIKSHLQRCFGIESDNGVVSGADWFDRDFRRRGQHDGGGVQPARQPGSHIDLQPDRHSHPDHCGGGRGGEREFHHCAQCRHDCLQQRRCGEQQADQPRQSDRLEHGGCDLPAGWQHRV
jgi:autotransporter-associated beta strand protein